MRCGKFPHNSFFFEGFPKAYMKPFETELKDKFHQLLGIVAVNGQLTGNQARTLLDPNNIPKVMMCLNSNVSQLNQTKFKRYLEGLCYFNSVFRSEKPKEEFNMEEFDRKQVDFQVFLREELSWVEPGHYLHIGLCHAREILETQDSIGTHSCEAPEGKNKQALWLATNASRRNDTWRLARDIFMNDHMLTSPMIQEYGRPKPVHVCHVCHDYRKNCVCKSEDVSKE